MTAREVADLLRVHRNTVKRIPPDQLPYVVVSNRGDRRYRLIDVDTYVRSRMRW